MPTFPWKPKKLAEIFQFLDQLRESGVTNMYGAGPYVEEAFNFSRDRARSAVIMWMRTFSDDKPAERARKALSEQEPSP